MKTTLWLTSFSLLLSPLGLSKTELETLRSTVAEQERQIRQLEEENMKLRSLNGLEVKNTATATPAPKAPTATGSDTYTIRAGDTLAKIARNTSSSAEAIARANGIKNPAKISIGQKLKIPGKAATASAAATPSATAAAPSPASPAAGGETYVVRNGDTFYSIARKHKVSSESLVAANPGIKPSGLRAGQLIRLSAKQAPAVAASTPAPSAPATSKTVAHEPAPAKPAPSPELSKPAEPATAKSPAPAPAPSPAAPSSPAPSPTPAPKTAVHSVTIDGEMTYGEFAAKHGTQIERLNELNGLDLNQNTVLAKGSELYVSAQP